MAKRIKKDYLVIGLGQFGMSVAKTLSKQGCGVIALDKEKEKVQAISKYVDYAVVADATDAEMLENLGLEQVDTAIISVTNDMESSILATIHVKEMGVSRVVVKAISEIHEKIALKVGADMIVFPEKDMGERTARNLTAGNFVDLVELSPEISIVEMAVKSEWVGRNLIELDFRKKYGVNIIAIKENEEIDVTPLPTQPLKEGQILVIIGSYKSLSRIDQK